MILAAKSRKILRSSTGPRLGLGPGVTSCPGIRVEAKIGGSKGGSDNEIFSSDSLPSRASQISRSRLAHGEI